MRHSNALGLPTLVLSALAFGAPAHATPASASETEPGAIDAVYCVTVGPGDVAGIVVYPGGKYCVPGP